MKFWLTIGLFALGTGPALAQVPPEAQDKTYRDGQSYQMRQNVTMMECSSECGGDALCRSWNFVPPLDGGDRGVCELNADAPTAQPARWGYSGLAANYTPILPGLSTGGLRVIGQRPAPKPQPQPTPEQAMIAGQIPYGYTPPALAQAAQRPAPAAPAPVQVQRQPVPQGPAPAPASYQGPQMMPPGFIPAPGPQFQPARAPQMMGQPPFSPQARPQGPLHQPMTPQPPRPNMQAPVQMPPQMQPPMQQPRGFAPAAPDADLFTSRLFGVPVAPAEPVRTAPIQAAPPVQARPAQPIQSAPMPQARQPEPLFGRLHDNDAMVQPRSIPQDYQLAGAPPR